MSCVECRDVLSIVCLYSVSHVYSVFHRSIICLMSLICLMSIHRVQRVHWHTRHVVKYVIDERHCRHERHYRDTRILTYSTYCQVFVTCLYTLSSVSFIGLFCKRDLCFTYCRHIVKLLDRWYLTMRRVTCMNASCLLYNTLQHTGDMSSYLTGDTWQ